MGDGDAYAGRMLDRMRGIPSRMNLENRSSQTSTLVFILEFNVFALFLRNSCFQGIMKGGVSEAEALRNFYANFSSKCLFWRVFAGCSGMNRRKEKPPETCLFPVV